METVEAIKAHRKELLSDNPVGHQSVCVICHGKPKAFKLHERRERKFLVIEDGLVREIKGLLGRWKCPLCGKTFTEYPPFAMPYKQYVSDVVISSSTKYIEEDAQTYEGVCRGCGYAGDGVEIDERMLAPSTVWRWVSSLGELKLRVSWAQGLIREKDPSSKLFRAVWPVSERKYRTERRGRVLARVRRLFAVAEEFERLFSRSIFPDFATREMFG